HLQTVADPDFAGGFCRLTVGLNAAELTGARGERSRLEKARGPEPLVHPHRALSSHTEHGRSSGRRALPRNQAAQLANGGRELVGHRARSGGLKDFGGGGISPNLIGAV